MKIDMLSLSMTYPSGRMALEPFSLSLPEAGLVGLLGPNGAGKSTLIRLMTAALTPTQGKILVDGVPPFQCERAFKSNLGLLPQRFGLYDELTCEQFLRYMASLKGIVPAAPAIERALAQTNLLDKRRARIRTLSGGQRQRVGIAQALLGNPRLLILDEPTVGLDPEERVRLRSLFAECAQTRLVLLSTHIIDDIQAVCDRLIVLSAGRVLFSGTPHALIAASRGHVGLFPGGPGDAPPGVRVLSQVSTAGGPCCRCAAPALPACVQEVEPTLEDAYLCLSGGEVTLP
ncbi:MAG: ATP-binding cassette domain-containing protein [Clostridia bacterium]|nr:ATP-binding cassette domain-containing protein [Clostridia bacterium]